MTKNFTFHVGLSEHCNMLPFQPHHTTFRHLFLPGTLFSSSLNCLLGNVFKVPYVRLAKKK